MFTSRMFGEGTPAGSVGRVQFVEAGKGKGEATTKGQY